MIIDRTCTMCGLPFRGGPSALYCPSCKPTASREAERLYRARRKVGGVRPLGSTDACERCGADYVVNASAQRYCNDCQLAHRLEHDAETAAAFYAERKDEINPIRNERRRVGMRSCAWCGKDFNPEGTRRATCSEECAKQHKNRRWREAYKRKNTPSTE